jgi:hypothetical protein
MKGCLLVLTLVDLALASAVVWYMVVMGWP